MKNYLLIIILFALVCFAWTCKVSSKKTEVSNNTRVEINCLAEVLDTLVRLNIDWTGHSLLPPVPPLPYVDGDKDKIKDSTTFDAEMKIYKRELSEYRNLSQIKVYINDTLFERARYLKTKGKDDVKRIINTDSIFSNRVSNKKNRLNKLRPSSKEKADIKYNFTRVKFNDDLNKGDFVVDYEGKFTADTFTVFVELENSQWVLKKKTFGNSGYKTLQRSRFE